MSPVAEITGTVWMLWMMMVVKMVMVMMMVMRAHMVMCHLPRRTMAVRMRMLLTLVPLLHHLRVLHMVCTLLVPIPLEFALSLSSVPCTCPLHVALSLFITFPPFSDAARSSRLLHPGRDGIWSRLADTNPSISFGSCKARGHGCRAYPHRHARPGTVAQRLHWHR